MAHPGRPKKCDPKVNNLRSNIALDRTETVMQTLREFGIDATDGHGRTALINAVIEGKEDFVIWLIENGANLNHRDRIGYTALHFTAQEKGVRLANLLLEKGADPNLQDIHGNSPLWTAVMNAKLPSEEQGVVNLLFQHGADPDVTNNYGKTPNTLLETFRNSRINRGGQIKE